MTANLIPSHAPTALAERLLLAPVARPPRRLSHPCSPSRSVRICPGPRSFFPWGVQAYSERPVAGAHPASLWQGLGSAFRWFVLRCPHSPWPHLHPRGAHHRHAERTSSVSAGTLPSAHQDGRAPAPGLLRSKVLRMHHCGISLPGACEGLCHRRGTIQSMVAIGTLEPLEAADVDLVNMFGNAEWPCVRQALRTHFPEAWA